MSTYQNPLCYVDREKWVRESVCKRWEMKKNYMLLFLYIFCLWFFLKKVNGLGETFLSKLIILKKYFLILYIYFKTFLLFFIFHLYLKKLIG